MAVPTQLDNPIALVNHTPDGDQLQEQEQESSSEDESTDPQYYAQPQPQVVMAPGPGTPIFSPNKTELICRQPVGYVTIRIPLENKVFCDIDFPTDIPCEDFFDYVFANMALDSATAELGWKANDEPERGPVHRLATNDPADLDHAFQKLSLKKKRSSQREVFMEIIHLVCFAFTIQQLTDNVYRTLHRSKAERRITIGQLTLCIALSCAMFRRNCFAAYIWAPTDGAM